MAVLQKIRNRGVLLVAAIAVALFLFVIGDAIRGSESFLQQSRQNIGEIDGESVSIQDYQQLIEDFQTYYEIIQQKSSFSEEELDRIKDEAWQTHVQSKLIESECAKLGIAVTDEEVAEVIKTGASQMLQVPFFMNQQTGRYDYSQLQTFITEYKKLKDSGQQVPEAYEKIYKYYIFAQKQIRQQALATKYQSLLSQCILSNSVEAKLAFDSRAEESDILLAAIPFSKADVKDDAVTDAEITAKYNEDKEKYRQYIETRDVKIISINVTPSDADKKALEKDMADFHAKLQAATDAKAAGNVVRQSSSVIPYTDVYKTKDAFPQMIQARLDSASAAITKAEFDPATNTYYTYKVLGQKQEADSVLFRQMAVIGKDEADIAKKADSIMSALQSGANFKDMAKKYNQQGDSAWIASAQFQQAQLDADNALFISTIYSANANEVKKLKLDNGNTIILQILEKRNMVTKYNVAAIVKELKFSDDTYSSEYNKFSSFVATYTTLEEIEANAAKSGYTVTPIADITSSQHGIAGIRGTRDALKWAFDEAKVGDVSQLYECGSNDNLLLVVLTGINKDGYRAQDKVKDDIKAELLNDKKAEKLIADLKGVTSIAAAKSKGAEVDSVNHVSFAAPSFVRTTNASEPIVSAVAAKTAKGSVSAPFKGNNGVYMLQVLNKNKTAEKYDVKTEKTTLAQTSLRYVANGIMNTLYLNAKVKDQRYKFY